MEKNVFGMNGGTKEKYIEYLQEWLLLVREGREGKEAWNAVFVRKPEEKTDGEPVRMSDGITGGLCGYTDWLLLPKDTEKDGMSEEQVRQWNHFVLSVHARTELYRQGRETLIRLAETILALPEDPASHTETAHRLTGIPEPEPVFCIGRENELSRIFKLLQKEGTAFLCGMGGSGKTTLAKAYVRAHFSEYDTVLFAHWDGSIRRMIADDHKICISGVSWQPTGRRGELGWYCRKKLQLLKENTDGRTLLVFDGVDSFEKGYPEKLFDLPCHILVTTRCRLPAWKKYCIPVGPLEKTEDRRKLFSFVCGKTETEEPDRIFESADRLCRGHTLSLYLFAKQLKEAETPEAMENLKDPENPEILKEAETPDNLPAFNRLPDLFALSALSRKEQQILRNAALLPAEGMSMGDFLLFSEL